jgi:Flp pilus assembly pilin Flp
MGSTRVDRFKEGKRGESFGNRLSRLSPMRGLTLDKGLMVDKMTSKKFLKEEKGGPITTEYVVFVAFAGIVLAVGAGFLFNAMRDLFTTYAGYFSGG